MGNSNKDTIPIRRHVSLVRIAICQLKLKILVILHICYLHMPLIRRKASVVLITWFTLY